MCSMQMNFKRFQVSTGKFNIWNMYILLYKEIHLQKSELRTCYKKTFVEASKVIDKPSKVMNHYTLVKTV